MFNKEQIIFSATKEGDFKEMCLSVLEQLSACQNIIKITFFHQPKDNAEYLYNTDIIKECIGNFFDNNTLISYVAQKPYGTSLVAEVLVMYDDDTVVERKQQYTVLKKGENRELITAGIICKDLDCSVKEQSRIIFDTLHNILIKEGFSINDIYRQWNYINDITGEQNGLQNYQEFNDARSSFYSQTEWQNGYPSATGIGQNGGGIMVEIFASKGNTTNTAIDNPMQIAAHNYSQNVLAGMSECKTTPKFERARLVDDHIYISGTAAIKGEESICSNDSVIQTSATMEIMNCLISPKNIPTNCTSTKYSTLRVYVKHDEDIKAIKEFMDNNYPAPQKIYLKCDICRRELLVEIEGTGCIA